MGCRITVDGEHRLVLPEDLVDKLKIEPGSELIYRIESNWLIIEFPHQTEVEPDRVEYDMIEAGLFWTAVEIAYFKDHVRVRCKDPKIEAWGQNKETAVQSFRQEASSHRHPAGEQV